MQQQKQSKQSMIRMISYSYYTTILFGIVLVLLMDPNSAFTLVVPYDHHHHHHHRSNNKNIHNDIGTYSTLHTAATTSSITKIARSTRITKLYLLPTQGNQLIAASTCAYDDDATNLQKRKQQHDYDDNDDNDAISLTRKRIHNRYDNNNNNNAENGKTTSNPSSSSLSSSTLAAAARTLVSNVFAVPKTLRLRSFSSSNKNDTSKDDVVVGDDWISSEYYYSTHQNTNNNNKNDNDNKKEPDVQLYPIVGFVYVNDAPDHSRPLPTVANASCILHYNNGYNIASTIINTTFHADPNKIEVIYGWYTPAVCYLNDNDDDTEQRLFGEKNP